MNWFTDKLYDLGASPRAGEAAWGELAAQDAMSPRVRANYYEGLEMPKTDPRARGWAPDAEKTFQAGIRATPWFAEFKQRFGEEPDLDTPDYDYRKAWAAGSRPDVRDPGDKLLHWSSQFKGENHPNRYVNGVDTLTGARMGDVAAMPGTADWMMPPTTLERAGEPAQEVARRFGASGLTPPAARSAADAYRMGGLAATDRYKPNTWRDVDREAIEERYGGADVHGIKLPPVSKGEPRAWVDALVPQTPLDVGLTVAGGPVGGKLARGGAAALGALFQSDEAEASALGKVGKAVLGGKPGGPHPGGIRVYHSSPHDFDKFDWSKLRTGEGANVYGSGFYFAENPKVSGQGGEYWRAFKDRFEGTPEGKAAKFLEMNNFNRQAAIDFARHQAELAKGMSLTNMFNKEARRSTIEQAEKTVRVLEGNAPVGPRTYEVNIAARPELMLDWDKPLSQQSEHVRKALPDIVKRDEMYRNRYPHSPLADPFGSNIYTQLQATGGKRIPGADTQASEMLREAGIPGIRYLDQGSRPPSQFELERAKSLLAGAEMHGDPAWVEKQRANVARLEALMTKPGTYNYVVTDPSKLDILAKYGVVGGAPVGMGALAAQDRYR